MLSVLLLLAYHLRHLALHFGPYLKRLSMFERRSFYAPPTIKTMETVGIAAACMTHASSHVDQQP